jgi:hypothetical protein
MLVLEVAGDQAGLNRLAEAEEVDRTRGRQVVTTLRTSYELDGKPCSSRLVGPSPSVQGTKMLPAPVDMKRPSRRSATLANTRRTVP